MSFEDELRDEVVGCSSESTDYDWRAAYDRAQAQLRRATAELIEIRRLREHERESSNALGSGKLSEMLLDNKQAEVETLTIALRSAQKGYARLKTRLEGAEHELRRRRNEALEQRAGMLPLTDHYWRTLFELVAQVSVWSESPLPVDLPASLKAAVKGWKAARLAAALDGEGTTQAPERP